MGYLAEGSLGASMQGAHCILAHMPYTEKSKLGSSAWKCRREWRNALHHHVKVTLASTFAVGSAWRPAFIFRHYPRPCTRHIKLRPIASLLKPVRAVHISLQCTENCCQVNLGPNHDFTEPRQTILQPGKGLAVALRIFLSFLPRPHGCNVPFIRYSDAVQMLD